MWKQQIVEAIIVGELWGNRLIKSAMSKVVKYFPSWSGSQVIQSEGNFLLDEFLSAQTWSGILYGDVDNTCPNLTIIGYPNTAAQAAAASSSLLFDDVTSVPWKQRTLL